MGNRKRVVITIIDGLPEVAEKPEGVDVEIWDFDTSPECYPASELQQDEDGNGYVLRRG